MATGSVTDEDWVEDYSEYAVPARQFSEKIQKLCGGYFSWIGDHNDPTNYHIMHSWLDCWIRIPMGVRRIPLAETSPISRFSCVREIEEAPESRSLVFSDGAGDGLLYLWAFLP